MVCISVSYFIDTSFVSTILYYLLCKIALAMNFSIPVPKVRLELRIRS
jgi:hypothetical protein